MKRPANAIDAAVNVDKETLGGKLFDGALHDLANLNLGNLHELLLEDRRLQGELEKTVERSVADDSSLVRAANLVGTSVGGERRGVLI